MVQNGPKCPEWSKMVYYGLIGFYMVQFLSTKSSKWGCPLGGSQEFQGGHMEVFSPQQILPAYSEKGSQALAQETTQYTLKLCCHCLEYYSISVLPFVRSLFHHRSSQDHVKTSEKSSFDQPNMVFGRDFYLILT